MPRVVYSLRFEAERQPGEPITEFIVPLDRQGNGLGHVETQKRYKLTAVSAYRQHQVSDEVVASGDISPDGYLVPS